MLQQEQSHYTEIICGPKRRPQQESTKKGQSDAVAQKQSILQTLKQKQQYANEKSQALGGRGSRASTAVAPPNPTTLPTPRQEESRHMPLVLGRGPSGRTGFEVNRQCCHREGVEWWVLLRCVHVGHSLGAAPKPEASGQGFASVLHLPPECSV